jgi:uncharacterized protein (DUF983 family)
LKFICPHCNQKAISNFSKFLSSESSPAVCKSCGEYSCAVNDINATYQNIVFLSLLVSIFISFFIQNISLLAVWLIFTISFPFYSLYRVPLKSLDKALVKKNKSKKLIGIIVFGLFLLLVKFAG